MSFACSFVESGLGRGMEMVGLGLRLGLGIWLGLGVFSAVFDNANFQYI